VNVSGKRPPLDGGLFLVDPLMWKWKTTRDTIEITVNKPSLKEGK
jgi:hypothetical protein